MIMPVQDRTFNRSKRQKDGPAKAKASAQPANGAHQQQLGGMAAAAKQPKCVWPLHALRRLATLERHLVNKHPCWQ